jgi:hypothetical protein
MKTVLLCLCCFFYCATFAQLGGEKVNGPVKFNDTLILNIGDTLLLGSGSADRGDFKNIYIPANYYIGLEETSLQRKFARSTLIIKGFRKISHKKIGEKIVAVVNLGGFNDAVDVVSAIEDKEIVAINGKPVGPAALAVNLPAAAKSSAADELLKLKSLLDAGLITKEEFEAQKKKILGQ